MGQIFGKHKISPTVSPNKTVEGFLGGLGTTVFLATLLGPAMTMFDYPRTAIAGLIIGVTGLLGDLNISALKRDLGVKDAGATLPGHGGVLDRIDSLIFTAPVFFHFVRFCYRLADLRKLARRTSPHTAQDIALPLFSGGRTSHHVDRHGDECSPP